MEQNPERSPFLTSLLTALFVGIIDTLICLTFNLAYRSNSGYTPSDIINVSSLIFVINLLFVVIGVVHFALLRAFGRNDIVYMIVFVALTVWCVWGEKGMHRFSDPADNTGFHGLLLGITLILGVSASFAVPFLSHNRKFLDAVI